MILAVRETSAERPPPNGSEASATVISHSLRQWFRSVPGASRLGIKFAWFNSSEMPERLDTDTSPTRALGFRGREAVNGPATSVGELSGPACGFALCGPAGQATTVATNFRSI